MQRMPDGGEPTSEPDGPVPSVEALGLRIEIVTANASVVLDGVGATEARAYALWASVRRHQLSNERSRLTGGSVNGFQIEQADEGLNNRLPGGDVT